MVFLVDTFSIMFHLKIKTWSKLIIEFPSTSKNKKDDDGNTSSEVFYSQRRDENAFFSNFVPTFNITDLTLG